MPTLEEEINDVFRKLETCFQAGDMVAFSNFYTEDCKLILHGWPMINGREATVKPLMKFIESVVKTTKLMNKETGGAGGDVVYSRGEYTNCLGDGIIADEGKFVVLWKRVNGQLQLYADIFTSNKF